MHADFHVVFWDGLAIAGALKAPKGQKGSVP
jgi:hypothetical protein